MGTKKPAIKNQILADYLINSSHDLKSVGGLVVSGIVSTFGVYSIVLPFFTDGETVNTSTLNTALIAFVVMLIIFDTVKRGSLTKFFNSLLKKKIISSKAKKGYLIIAVFATVFMVLLDALGSYATAEKGANLYSQFKTNSSTEFQILQQNAESGKATASNYTLVLQAWKESKSEAHQNCVDKFKGWKAKYKANCKTEWNNAHPMPVQTTDGQIKIDDYKAIKKDGQGFLDEWLFIILFTLLSLMTLLMQYLTISKIYDDYNDIEESLTFERIEFINDNIQEHETILAEHEQQTAELMVNSKREKNHQDRKFQKVGEAIAIEHKKKNVETRGKTVKRIANNTYVPTEEAKAGHIVNPFAEEDSNKREHSYLDKRVMELLSNKGFNVQDVNFEEYTVNFTDGSWWRARTNLGFINNNERHSSEIDDEQAHEIRECFRVVLKEKNQSVKRSTSNQPLNEEQEKTSQNDQPLNESVITDRKETEPLNGVVKRIDLKEYSSDDLELIDLLWKQSTVKRNDQLETRDNVIKIIGDNKNNTLRLRNLYKKLLADGYIYKRVGYFAKVEV